MSVADASAEKAKAIAQNHCHLPGIDFSFSQSNGEAFVEHRGMEFKVVRTIPKGWVWSVKRDAVDKIGTTRERDDAIKKCAGEMASVFSNRLRSSYNRAVRLRSGGVANEPV